MLEKPDLPDAQIVACLDALYGLGVIQLAFLPLGADPHTAVYRAAAADTTAYFVKLRRGAFDATSVTFPRWLSDQGITQIIPPLAATTGQLWAQLGEFTLMVYPFVVGEDGYAVALSDRHWFELGGVLRRMHTADVPAALVQHIPRETYDPQWRAMVKRCVAHAERDTFADPIAAEVATLLREQQAVIRDLVARTEQLAQTVQASDLPCVVCHGDMHAANILIDAHAALYLVDWDTLIRAPKERDLMFVGGGQFAGRLTPREEEIRFYKGYGDATVDPFALTYYRYERIIQDIAVYCEQLLLSTEGGDDRAQSLYYLRANFLPNGVLALAADADPTSASGEDARA